MKLLSLVLALGLAQTAQAQTFAENTHFPAERLRLSLNRNGLIDVEWGRVLPHLRFDAGLWIGYAHDPIILEDRATGRTVLPLVRNRLSAAFMGTIGLFEWAEIGLEIPIALYQSRPGRTELSSLAVAGFSDIRIAPKVRLLRSDQHFIDLAVYLPFTIPSGGEHQYLGESTVTFKPELLVSRGFVGWRVGANLGVDIREHKVTAVQEVGPELSYRLGGGYRFKDIHKLPFEVDVSVSGTAALARRVNGLAQSSLEARAMLAYDIIPMVQVFAGPGVGLLSGWGTPDFRVFTGVRIGFVDPPPPPPEPASEPASAPASAPVVPDTDGDGLKDDVDKCPNEAEDFDKFEDEDGCPDPDNDKDGVLDVSDKCPLEAGPADNAGCPDKDTDGDGVPDRVDNCPNEPGPASNQGCAQKQMVVITREKLEITESVYFDNGKDTIKKESFPLLDNVATVLGSHPEIAHMRVEGHTDNAGQAAKNKALSQRRAEAVVKYIVGKGVDAGRLNPKGYGQDRPIAPNTSAKGKARNRRVEFVITAE